MRKILLISGGFDSLLIYKMKPFINNYIYFDYGDTIINQELKRIEKLPVKVEIIKLPKINCNENKFFYGRNLRFIMAVREKYPDENILVYIGNNADDNFPDNTREYFYRLEGLINNSYPNTLRIICPLQDFTKEEICAMAKQYEDLIALNPYYCDTGNDEPCRKCHSCLAMISAGML